MRNQLQTCLLPDDESALSLGLRSRFETIFFVDHREAQLENVTLYSDLNACHSGFAYIWDAETTDISGAVEKWNGLVREKSGDGAIVQFLRSRMATEQLVDGQMVSLLLSGRVAMMGTGTSEQKALKSNVYEVLSGIATAQIYPVSPTTRKLIGQKRPGSRVGVHAVKWSEEPSHLLRTWEQQLRMDFRGVPPRSELRRTAKE
ncbi:MAG: hypothetical protein AB8G99_20100 [Planctomycetaceae bacterium]